MEPFDVACGGRRPRTRQQVFDAAEAAQSIEQHLDRRLKVLAGEDLAVVRQYLSGTPCVVIADEREAPTSLLVTSILCAVRKRSPRGGDDRISLNVGRVCTDDLESDWFEYRGPLHGYENALRDGRQLRQVNAASTPTPVSA